MAVGDAYRKVSSGERLIIPAAFHNATVDVIRAFKGSAFDLDSLHSATDKQATVIKFQNDTGRDLDQWDVLGIGGPLVTPAGNFNEFARQVAVSGGIPSERGKFGILLEPINAGHIGRAYASGVTIAKVRFTGESDTRADVDTGETSQLKTDPRGGAFILWKGTPVDTSGGYYSGSGGSDVYWCIVRLSNPLGEPCPNTEFRFFDLKCENGKLKKYYTPITIDENGCPQAGTPVFAGEAGCCGCGGSTSGGGGGGGGDSGGSGGGGGGGDIVIPPGPCISPPDCGCKLALCDVPELTATVTVSCNPQNNCAQALSGSWVLQGSGSVTCVNGSWKFCYNDWRRLVIVSPTCNMALAFTLCQWGDAIGTCNSAMLQIQGTFGNGAFCSNTLRPLSCTCNMWHFTGAGFGGCFCNWDVVITR